MDDLHAGNHSTPSTRTGEEYNVENADYISEMLVSDILTSSIGKQSLKLLYNYLRKNSEWLFQKLNVSDIELSEFKLLPGQNITEDEDNLLNLMFHIGHQPFDQVRKIFYFLFYCQSWIFIKCPKYLTVANWWHQN